MCPSAPRLCSEPGGQKPILSLSLDRIQIWSKFRFIGITSKAIISFKTFRANVTSQQCIQNNVSDGDCEPEKLRTISIEIHIFIQEDEFHNLVYKIAVNFVSIFLC